MGHDEEECFRHKQIDVAGFCDVSSIYLNNFVFIKSLMWKCTSLWGLLMHN